MDPEFAQDICELNNHFTALGQTHFPIPAIAHGQAGFVASKNRG